MKRLEKQLQSKANFSQFFNVIALILGLNSAKDLKVSKFVKQSSSKRFGSSQNQKMIQETICKTFFAVFVFINSKIGKKESYLG